MLGLAANANLNLCCTLVLMILFQSVGSLAEQDSNASKRVIEVRLITAALYRLLSDVGNKKRRGSDGQTQKSQPTQACCCHTVVYKFLQPLSTVRLCLIPMPCNGP